MMWMTWPETKPMSGQKRTVASVYRRCRFVFSAPLTPEADDLSRCMRRRITTTWHRGATESGLTQKFSRLITPTTVSALCAAWPGLVSKPSPRGPPRGAETPCRFYKMPRPAYVCHPEHRSTWKAQRTNPTQHILVRCFFSPGLFMT